MPPRVPWTLLLLLGCALALTPFEGASWVTPPHGDSPGGNYLRFEFDVPVGTKVVSASVHVSGLGHVELSLNGAKLGHYELETGWSNYNKTCYFSSHKLAGSLFQEGLNVFGAVLGNGMYLVADLLPRYTKFITDPVFGPRALMFDATYVTILNSVFRHVGCSALNDARVGHSCRVSSAVGASLV